MEAYGLGSLEVANMARDGLWNLRDDSCGVSMGSGHFVNVPGKYARVASVKSILLLSVSQPLSWYELHTCHLRFWEYTSFDRAHRRGLPSLATCVHPHHFSVDDRESNSPV